MNPPIGPCLHCGADDSTVAGTPGRKPRWVVKCLACGAQTGRHDTAADAVAHWNGPASPVPALVAACRAAIPAIYSTRVREKEPALATIRAALEQALELPSTQTLRQPSAADDIRLREALATAAPVPPPLRDSASPRDTPPNS